jgi:hypothetical protein
MNQGKYVFAQIMEHLSRTDFESCIKEFHGEKYVKSFSCHDQLLAMMFGQLSYRGSLRDVIACLSAHKQKLYHLGFRSDVSLPTLAHANEKRDWRIYQKLAEILMEKTKKLYFDIPDITSDFKGVCYAIDSTSIELCLNLFRWAPYIETKGAVKLHLLMDLRGSIPAFFDMTSGKVNDVKFLDKIVFESGAFYVMDRGYIDFERLYKINTVGAFFVIRLRNNIHVKRRYSNPVDKTTGVLSDQIVFLNGLRTPKRYPEMLRRVKYRDEETGQVYVYLTNNFAVSSFSIALLYKNRWKIELFFKWIKQHLKIKVFWGHSENSVKTQICIALCSYLIVALIKKRLRLKRNLYEILQILSVSLFDKTPLLELFSDDELQSFIQGDENTASLFEF